MSTQKVNYQITGENLLSKVLRQIDSDANKTEQSINNISKGSGSGGLMGSIVGANLLTSAIQKTAGAIYNFGKESIDAYGRTESYEARLTTLLGSRKAAELDLINLRKDAAKTPFDVASLIQANSLLIGSGESAGNAEKAVMDLGNAIAATGGGSDELSRMAVNLAQIKTLGKASALDIKQFAYANIPIYKILSESMKKPIEQVKTMDVSYKDLTKALADARKEGGMFANGLENASNTLNGLRSNLDDTIESLKSNIGETFADTLKDSLRGLLPIMDEFNRKMMEANSTSKVLNEQGLGFRFFESLATKGEMGSMKTALDKNVAFASQGETQAKLAEKSINQFLKDITFKFNDEQFIYEATGEGNKPDAQKYLREVALIKDALISIKEVGKKATEGNLKTGASNGGANEKLGTGVTVEAHAPKNQYITINGGLVHQMTIESMDGSTPTGEIKDQISTVLVELLNDAYQAQV
jgi:tape measure domain-containing protein